MSDSFPNGDPYTAIGELYDLEHDEFVDDVPFYLNAIQVVGDPVLELGCGSGRLVRPIAKAGHRITGLDRSAAMLARLSGSIRGSRFASKITAFRGDFVDAADAPGGPFGVVMFSLNGLMHVSTPDAQIAALRAARSALDPRGQLIIDAMNPSPATLREFDGRVNHEGAWHSADGRAIDKFSVRRLDATHQVIHTRIWYDTVKRAGSVERVASEFDLRYIHRHELELMLRFTGFTDWHFYGSYELDSLDDASERMLVTAEVGESR